MRHGTSDPVYRGRLRPHRVAAVLPLIMLAQSRSHTRGKESQGEGPKKGYACSHYPRCDTRPREAREYPPMKCGRHHEEMVREVTLDE